MVLDLASASKVQIVDVGHVTQLGLGKNIWTN